MNRNPQHTQPPTHCMLPSFGATVKRRGPWLSQFRGVKGSRAPLERAQPRPRGNVTHLVVPSLQGWLEAFCSAWPWQVPESPCRVDMNRAAASYPLPRPMGLTGPDFLPLYPGMSSGPSTPSLRVPCARCLSHSLGAGSHEATPCFTKWPRGYLARGA